MLETAYHITSRNAFLIYFILLCFRFGGTCEEHARLLHRYIHGNVVCCLPPHHLYLAFLPMLSLPNSPPLTAPPIFPPDRFQCVMLPSLCPCVLIVQNPPMSEITWGEMSDIGDGEEGSKQHCHVCTYATILHVLHIYPQT